MTPLRRRFVLRFFSLGLLSILIFVCGCGTAKKEAELAPIVGTVKINGKPAANILVQFLPQVAAGDPAPTSTGVSNEQGEYELTTAEGKVGAVVGHCKVLFVDMAEERPPQGIEASPPRISSQLAVLGPRSKEVEVSAEHPIINFDL